MKLINNKNLLNQAQTVLLQHQAAASYTFGGFQSIDDILSKLNVNVRIESGIIQRTVPEWLSEEKKKCQAEIEKARQDPSRKEEFNNLCKKIDELGANENYLKAPLRGLYDPRKNEIILFPEEMYQEQNGSFMDELLISTLVHETMHAYFNRPGHEKFNYAMYIEEPLAEFGMLLFLHETKSQYYAWAYSDVSKKRTCYRFGAGLMDQFLLEGSISLTRLFLEDYKSNNLPKNYYPTINSNNNISIILPYDNHSFNGVTSKWQKIYNVEPQYFYDSQSHTLGLDGEWSEDELRRIKYRPMKCLRNIYLGDSFIMVNRDQYSARIEKRLFSKFYIIVSPNNTNYSCNNGILICNNSIPALPKCGNGLYKRFIMTKGWGIVDQKFNEICPCQYFEIGEYDINDRVIVRKKKYGLLDTTGRVVIKLEYDDIELCQNGIYEVLKDGIKFNIDKDGNVQ